MRSLRHHLPLKRGLRTVAVLLAAALLTVGFASAARADGPWTGGQVAVVTPASGYFPSLLTPQSAPAVNGYDTPTLYDVYKLTFASGVQPAYCLDRATEAAWTPTYGEAGSASAAGVTSAAAGIDWVLRHSEPALTVDQVLAQVGATTADFAGMPHTDQAWLTPDFIVRAITQNVIWDLRGQMIAGPVTETWFPSFQHYYPSATLANVMTLSQADAWTETSYLAAAKLYNFLLAGGKAPTAAVAPTLSVTSPVVASGAVGTLVGPYTVNAAGDGAITLVASAGTITDAAGAPLTTFVDGMQFWVKSADIATITVTASATSSTATTHWMAALDEAGQPVADTQPIGFATTTAVPLSATATAVFFAVSPPTPTATPSPTATPIGPVIETDR